MLSNCAKKLSFESFGLSWVGSMLFCGRAGLEKNARSDSEALGGGESFQMVQG